MYFSDVDLPIGFPINNIISLSPFTIHVTCVLLCDNRLSICWKKIQIARQKFAKLGDSRPQLTLCHVKEDHGALPRRTTWHGSRTMVSDILTSQGDWCIVRKLLSYRDSIQELQDINPQDFPLCRWCFRSAILGNPVENLYISTRINVVLETGILGAFSIFRKIQMNLTNEDLYGELYNG